MPRGMINSGVYTSLFAISTGNVSTHVVGDHLSVGSQRSGKKLSGQSLGTLLHRATVH
jgi:hypothetical protein